MLAITVVAVAVVDLVLLLFLFWDKKAMSRVGTVYQADCSSDFKGRGTIFKELNFFQYLFHKCISCPTFARGTVN